MMARSLKGSINRPDTEAQDQPSPNHHFRLATRGRSIQMGQKATMELFVLAAHSIHRQVVQDFQRADRQFAGQLGGW